MKTKAYTTYKKKTIFSVVIIIILLILFLFHFTSFARFTYVFSLVFIVIVRCLEASFVFTLSEGAGVPQLVLRYDDLLAVGLQSDCITIHEAWQARGPALEPLYLGILVAVKAVTGVRRERVCFTKT